MSACDEAPAPPEPRAVEATEATAQPPVEVPPEQVQPEALEPEAPPESVAAQHVLIAYRGAENAPSEVTRSKAEAEKLAQAVYERAKEGKDFSALVAEYSEDPGSKQRLGSVGKFKRDKMVKPFSDAAFGLKVNQVSPPVETKYGFHVIKRNQ